MNLMTRRTVNMTTNNCAALGIMISIHLGIVQHALLENVGFALKRNHIHEVERVCHNVDLVVA